MPKPPPLVLLAYRFLGWRVGPDHREWVHDDLTRKGWLLRQGAPVLAAVLLTGAVVFALLDGDGGRLLSLVFVLAAGGAFLRGSLRDRAVRQQGLDAAGDRLPNTAWYDDDRARLRRNLVGSVSTVVLVLGALVLLAVRTRP